ncbi:hypothetical protein CEXT_671161 [Caerostris extrusa]|uniref:Uncharacterized protein n=1 Tax=Caerostris extrusa TaxID=172846 RepID=A0AAV4NAP6_CAEEX|nr:hypothetical protein CEXT_671161 [Caerostris extrusa]
MRLPPRKKHFNWLLVNQSPRLRFSCREIYAASNYSRRFVSHSLSVGVIRVGMERLCASSRCNGSLTPRLCLLCAEQLALSISSVKQKLLSGYSMMFQ